MTNLAHPTPEPSESALHAAFAECYPGLAAALARLVTLGEPKADILASVAETMAAGRPAAIDPLLLAMIESEVDYLTTYAGLARAYGTTIPAAEAMVARLPDLR